MPSQDRGVPALGVLLKRGNGASPEVFTAIAEVYDITGPAVKLDTVDSTHLADQWKGFKPTLAEGGEIKFVVNMIPTDATQSVAQGLMADIIGKQLRNFQLVWPDASSTTWPFAAWVTGFAPKAPLTGMLRADITLKLDGAPAFT